MFETLELRTMEALRRFVADTLGGLENLKADQFELSQQVLFRSGKPCGVYFCLHCPLAMRLTAIWETEGNTILFYGSCGRRVQRTSLAAAPTLCT